MRSTNLRGDLTAGISLDGNAEQDTFRRMATILKQIQVCTRGRGTYEITAEVSAALAESSFQTGVATVFCCHTSSSLVLMENADPTARDDLHRFMDRLVPEDGDGYSHTLEGPDDMTSHIKMALTRSSESIPFANGSLCLGTWQGIFLWEHRDAPHTRQISIALTA